MSSSRSKWVIAILLVGLLGAYGAYTYAYKPHEATVDKQVDFKGSVEEFKAKVAENGLALIDKVVELKGTISSKGEADIVLGGSVYCQFENSTAPQTLQEVSSLTMRGRYIGYDELLEEIKLDKCIIID